MSIRTKFRSAACLLAAVCSPASAQQALPTPQADIRAAAPDTLRPALWRVTDSDTTIYLFGTVHALPAGLEWLDGPVANALEASDELVTEIIEGDQAEMLSGVMGMAVLPAGQSLPAIIGPKDHAALSALLKSYGLPPAAFDRYKPWYAAMILSVMSLMREGYGQESGAEAILEARAKELGKRHSALETLQFQLGVFDGLPLATQTRYLREVVTAAPSIKSELDAMVAEWGKGNADRLADLMNDKADDPVMLAALLYSRNATWAEWVETRMAKPGRVFVAVGAGHMAGAKSVQDLLAKRGVTVSRIQ